MDTRETAAIRVDGQYAARGDPTALDKAPALSLGTEAEVLKKKDGVYRECVIELDDVDVARSYSRLRIGACARVRRGRDGQIRHGGDFKMELAAAAPST